MRLDQMQPRLAELAEQGIQCRMAPGTSGETLDSAETRLGCRFPEQVRQFYRACDGLEVSDPPFKVYALSEMVREGPLLEFCRCDGVHRLALDTSMINEAGQWSIVNADTGYRITFTMASFWSIRMWSWIVKRRPIWYDLHAETTAG